MFVVKRCVQDYDDVFKMEAGKFPTEEEANAFIEVEIRCNPFSDVWFEIDEE
jgi:hypothetical protein